MTVKNKSKGKSRPTDLFGKSSMSTNVSEHGRALMLPQEVMQMDEDKCILILENSRPILCEKIKWYEDKTFSKRGNGRDGINHPSPMIPTIDLKTLKKGKIDFNNDASEVERAVKQSDLEMLELKNFTCNFDKIEIPKGNISDEEMKKLASSFINTIQSE